MLSIPIHDVHGHSGATGKRRRGHTHESEKVMIIAGVLNVVVDQHPHEDPLVLEVQQSRHVLQEAERAEQEVRLLSDEPYRHRRQE